MNYILIYLYVSKWHTIANLLVFTNSTFEVQQLSGLLAMSGAAHQQLKEMDFGDIMGNPQDTSGYPLVNKQLDPENHNFLMETSLPTPICQGLC